MMLLASSTIIKSIQERKSAALAFFYFDPQDIAKQDVRSLLAALLIQLSDKADGLFEVLSSFYSTHLHGAQEPSVEALTKCLADMMSCSLQLQLPVYIVIDGLDRCPNSYRSTSRQQVLKVMEDLVKVQTPHLHLCVTSRLEVDIRHVLKPLATKCVSLHDHPDQMKDIAYYIQSVVKSDTVMQHWPEEDKHLVVDKLTTHGGGMYVIIVISSIVISHDVTQVSMDFLPVRNAASLPAPNRATCFES
jgi:hypothetical protein